MSLSGRPRRRLRSPGSNAKRQSRVRRPAPRQVPDCTAVAPDGSSAPLIGDQGWATVNLGLSALAELEGEIAGRLGEPAIRQLRSTLLLILDRPAYTSRGGSSGPPT